MHQLAALERLQAFLVTPRRATECFEVLFGRPIGRSEYGLALGEAVGHLNHLQRTGRVVRDVTPDGVWLWTAC